MIAKLALASVPYAIDKPYDYLVPEEMVSSIDVGMRVFAPFSKGNRVVEGIVLSLTADSEYPDCKHLLRLADDSALFTREQIQLALFMRERYFCTVYEALRVMVPAGYWFNKSGKQREKDKLLQMVRISASHETVLSFIELNKRKSPKQVELLELLLDFEILPVHDLLNFTAAGKQSLLRLQELELVELYDQEIYRRPEVGTADELPLPVLNDEQEKTLAEIRCSAQNNKPGLLFGVTGSGKTSVYAHLISSVRQDDEGAILLVPEISLTPQFMSDFTSWFGNDVALLHSALTSGERYDEWKRIKRGQARIVIGTRSAVFAPVANLKLIIIDEEQEDSYLSETTPRYQTLEVARFRCIQHHASLLLGSATPDIRSRYLSQKGSYNLFRINSRYNSRPLPEVHIIDMRNELRKGKIANISKELIAAIQQRFERKEQSILFLNRRGTNKLVSCTGCGYVYRCPHCSVSMTWHANQNRLICHYCGFSRKLDRACPSCGSKLSFIGAGTQMIEKELRELFPESAVLRVDADSTSSVGAHRELFKRFTELQIPIMVGTQMIAKGLNFENVTLVGILSADQSLYSNDYRAGERSFSLFTQVIGRCGRGAKPGEAYIQTYTPDNAIIRFAAEQDYEAFYKNELEMRRIQNAPPFSDWISFSAAGQDEKQVIQALTACRDYLSSAFHQFEDIHILGPTPLTVVRVNDVYRYRIMIICNLNKDIRLSLSTLLTLCGTDRNMRGIHFYIEQNPEA